MFAVEYLL